MAETVIVPVVPTVLAWARRSASVSEEDAARAAGVTVERYRTWEQGDDRPTLPMLRKLAAKFKRPLSVMLLPRPPVDFMPLRDFRRTASGAVGALPPRVAYEIRFAYERRNAALELAQEMGAEPEPFTLRASRTDDPEIVGASVRQFLNIDGASQMIAARHNKVFELWRGAMESKGVLVFTMTGAHAPLVREVRGFAIPADLFPVAAVNGRDKTNGRTFTLLHEFAHLLLREGVVENALVPVRSLPPPVRALERFCNAVAAAALMPPDVVAGEGQRLNKDPASEWSDVELSDVAGRLGVSREALLLRMVERGFAARTFYTHKRRAFDMEYEAFDEPSAEKKELKIPPPNLVIGRYGGRFTRLVLDSYRDRHLTMSAAAGLLGVQAKHIVEVERLAARAA